MIWLDVAAVLLGLLLWQVWSTWRRPRIRLLRLPFGRYIRFYPNFGFRLGSKPEWSRHWGRR